MYTFDLIGCWDYGVFFGFFVAFVVVVFFFVFSFFFVLFCFIFFSTTPNRKALDNTQIRFINVITWLLS